VLTKNERKRKMIEIGWIALLMILGATFMLGVSIPEAIKVYKELGGNE
jgi:hypothetical protein